MIDIRFLRENPDVVKENIKKKFQDEKLPLVDEVFEMDIKVREAQTKADNLKAEKNKMSGEIGKLMKDKKIDEANEIKAKIAELAEEITELEATQETLAKEISKIDLLNSKIPTETWVGELGSALFGVYTAISSYPSPSKSPAVMERRPSTSHISISSVVRT